MLVDYAVVVPKVGKRYVWLTGHLECAKSHAGCAARSVLTCCSDLAASARRQFPVTKD